MAFDSKKTILLEKKYLYVRASLGFQLEGVSTEKIPTNNGFYRFYVDNLSKALGNSYVNILYDSQDLTLQCFCSDLYMDELMSSDSSAIEDVVEELKKNTSTILEFESGVSSALQSNHQDNVVLASYVKSLKDSFMLNESFFSINFDFRGSFVVCANLSDFNLSYTEENSLNSLYTYSCSIYPNCFFNSSSRVGVIYNLSYPSNGLPESLSCYFVVTYVNDDGSISSLTRNLGAFNVVITTTLPELVGKKVLKINYYFFLTVKVYKSFVSLDNSGKFSLSSFSANRLTLLSLTGLSCCFNQDFDYDFEGGYLDLYIYTSLSPSYLNECTLRFICDVGFVDIACSSINFVSRQNGLLVCNNIPNISFSNPSCKKLLGIRLI